MMKDRYSPDNLFLGGRLFEPISLTTMAVASAATTMAGSAVSAMGTIASGNAALEAGQRGQQAAYFTAAQQEQGAQESRAVAQRQALDKRHKADLLLSSLKARGAAGGTTISDGDVLDTAGEIAARGEYEALFDMYQGENRARGLQDQALASRMTGDAALAEGRAKKSASKLSAIGTIIGGAGSAMSNFGGKKAA
jgi:hypothetical protein